MKTLAALALAVGALAFVAPAAHADQASFLADVQNEGAFGQIPAVAIEALGQNSCIALARDTNSGLDTFERGVALGQQVSLPDFVQFVSLAARDLCPDAIVNNPVRANSAPATRTALTDQDFLNSVTHVGITGNPVQLVNTALTICGYITSGTSGNDVASDLHKAEPQRFSQDQASAYVAAAEANYCPANTGK